MSLHRWDPAIFKALNTEDQHLALAVRSSNKYLHHHLMADLHLLYSSSHKLVGHLAATISHPRSTEDRQDHSSSSRQEEEEATLPCPAISQCRRKDIKVLDHRNNQALSMHLHLRPFQACLSLLNPKGMVHPLRLEDMARRLLSNNISLQHQLLSSQAGACLLPRIRNSRLSYSKFSA
jgi:hypothetical protein